MQTDNLLIGTFIRELKNRFLCEVLIDGELSVCYVPSSCHLSNFLNLSNRKVLLVRNNSNSRTKYSLFSTPHKRSMILLNPSLANKIILDNINSRRFSFLGKRDNIHREQIINGYKSDIYIEDTKTLIEIKSVISINEVATFPTVFSERTLKQLKIIDSLLSNYNVYFFIVSLNPYVNEIIIDEKTIFYKSIKECIDKGLKILSYSVEYKNGIFKIKKCIPITIK